MFSKIFSNINKKAAEQLVSKAQPVIDKMPQRGKLIDEAQIRKNSSESPYNAADIAVRVG